MSADPFVAEEVHLTENDSTPTLMDLLAAKNRIQQPPDYRCDGCRQLGTTRRRECLFRLPEIYVIHLNRVCRLEPRTTLVGHASSIPHSESATLILCHDYRPGRPNQVAHDRTLNEERRVGSSVDFPDEIDIAEQLLYPGRPRDYSLRPCSTRYRL
eukprot:SAG11_NODE_7981_length_1074_cov_1.621538_1_plen_155_part_10